MKINIMSIMHKVKQSLFSKLISANSGVSSKSFFLVAVTIVGIILLLVPAIVLIIEACCNHTVATDLNGFAAYIGAVAGVFASAGITKAWSEKYEYKARCTEEQICEHCPVKDTCEKNN